MDDRGMNQPRYAYGDILLFGGLAAIPTSTVTGPIGALVAFALVAALVVVVAELGLYPYREVVQEER